jgi:hypothetical protein
MSSRPRPLIDFQTPTPALSARGREKAVTLSGFTLL